MLSPVANHQTQSHKHEGQQQDTEGSPRIDPEQGNQHGVIGQLPECSPESQASLSLAKKIHGQVDPDEKEEATDIVEEVPDVVALVNESGGEVLRAVSLDVMVLYVVIKVGVPGMTHQRIRDVGKIQVKQPELFVQNTSHMNVLMHHQSVGTHVQELHDKVNDTVQP